MITWNFGDSGGFSFFAAHTDLELAIPIPAELPLTEADRFAVILKRLI